MKTYTKILSLLLVCLMLASMVGCRGDTASSGTSDVGSDSNGAGVSQTTATTVEGNADDTGSTTSTTVAGGADTPTTQAGNQQTPSKDAAATTAATTANAKPTSLTRDQVMAQIPANLKKSTIKYFMWYDINTTPEAQVVKDFTAKTGIKIDMEVGSYGDFKTQLAGKIASEESPDLVRVTTNAISRVISLQPISKTGFNFNDTAWDTEVMDAYTFNGETYAVNLKNTAFSTAMMVFYNKAFFEENDIDDPATLYKQGKWDLEAFKRVAKQFIDAAGSDSYGSSFCPLDVINMMNGISYVGYDGKKYVNNLGDSRIANGWKTTKEMMESRLLSPDVFQAEKFERNKVGLLVYNVEILKKKSLYLNKFKRNNSLGFVPLPKMSNGTQYQPLEEMTAFGIPSGAKNAAAVPYFLRYMLDLDSYGSEAFYSKEAEAMYKQISQNSNKVTGVNEIEPITYLEYEIKQTSADQVGSIIQKYINEVNSVVNQFNQQIAVLEK